MSEIVLEDYQEENEKDKEKKKSKTITTSSSSDLDVKKGYVALNSSGFKDFLLKPELLKAIVDSGFEHPSEVQHRCIPQAILGVDVICQAKSGMGKTAVFVLTVLQQLEIAPNQIGCVVLCHTRELAYQISNEFIRFSKHLPSIKVGVFYGGIKVSLHRNQLKQELPSIVVGTPGRILQLCNEKLLDFSKVRHFILDECDKVLCSLKMRQDVQEIFKKTPINKQVMMFSATFSQEIKIIAKKFMVQPMEIFVDEESKLTLHGLQQYYILLIEKEKNQKLNALLTSLTFNQLVIFVKSVKRASLLNNLIVKSGHSSICIHSDMKQEERIEKYKSFKDFEKRILVSTDIFGRGMDIQRVNIVINYDMPENSDTYLHRVGRAGRFGTKGLAISFVSKEKNLKAGTVTKTGFKHANDEDVLKEIQDRFKVKISTIPDVIDPKSYMQS